MTHAPEHEPDHDPVDPSWREVDARGAQAVLIGDRGTQHITFVTPRPEVSWPVQVGVVPPEAGAFQPRPEITAALDTAIGEDGAAVLTQLIGLGGVGKSQIAAAHVRARRRELDLLVWVSATTQTAIIEAYARAAHELGHPPSSDPTDDARWFQAWLQQPGDPEQPRCWLVVLDDLTDPAHLRSWWPTGPHGGCVITTRRTDIHAPGRARVVPVGVFTPELAHDYLVAKIAGPAGSARLVEVDQLAADLGYLPVALSQAAAYIATRATSRAGTCAGYRTLLNDRRRQLAEVFLDSGLVDDYQHTVAATWSLSIEAADAEHPAGAARPLLELLAYLDPSGIPDDILDTPALTTQPSQQPAGAAGELPIAEASREAFDNLARYSLTEHSPDDGLIRVHALVQRATVDALTSDRANTTAHAAGDALHQLWPEMERDTDRAQILRANATTLFHRAGQALCRDGVHSVLMRAGRSWGETGLVTLAHEFWSELHHISHTLNGPDHPDTLTTRHNLAYWRGQAGDPTGAAAATAELLDDQLRVLGPDHPDTLTTRHNLAYWRGQAGDPAGAAAATAELLDDRLRVQGPDHPDTLITRHNLAYWRGEAGDPAGAAAAFAELLDDRLRVLGPDHPRTLITRHNLADWRGQAGDPAGAAAALAELLDDQLRVLGPDHPDTLTTRHNLAYRRGQAGDPTGAAAATAELLDDQLRVLGPDHPRTLTTRHNLATWRGQAGDPAGAAAATAELLDDRLRVLGPDHPDTLTTRHNLAYWQGKAGGQDGSAR